MSKDALVTPQQEWDLYQADPRAIFENISSGLRKSTISCQYFVSGLPQICKYWENGDPGKCTYGADPEVQKGIPSGYGAAGNTEDGDAAPGTCDFLGRRSWCDKYSVEPPETEVVPGEEEWFCCAPDPYRTGLTKLVHPEPEARDTTVRSLLKSEILGYCEEDGVGKCDGQGCGRGCDAGTTSLKELVTLPIVCSFYKPWRMGFGAISPQSYKTAIKEYGMVYEDAYEQFLKNRKLGKRLPIQFTIYNMRAKFQKCMWWDGDPSVFTHHELGQEGDVIRLNAYPGTKCTNNNPLTAPYTDPNIGGYDSPQYLLREVWASGNTIFCNGAKPECPCYTGKWEYCVDKKMYPGMKITAYQILELRFWTFPWKTQEQYNRFFESRPNWSDPTTAAIYTFTKWVRGTKDSTDGTLIGQRFRLLVDDSSKNSCNLIDYSVNSDYNIESEEIQYAKYSIEGTTTEDQVHYPTLVRDFWDFSAKSLVVIYPYSTTFDSPCEMQSNLMNHCFISSAGYTEQSSKVYFINSTFIQSFPPKYISNFLSVLDIPFDERSAFYEETKTYIETCLINFPNYIVTTASDSNGFYLASLLRVEYHENNILFIIVEASDGTYAFEKRYVFPKFGGGMINQRTFDYSFTGTNYMPGLFMPAASASFTAKSMGQAKGVSIYPISSYAPMSGPSEYTYSLDWVNVPLTTITKWTTIGPTYYLWVDLEDANLNYVFRWEFVAGTINIIDNDDNSYSYELEVVFPLVEDIEIALDGGEIKNSNRSGVSATIERISIPPSVLILKPKSVLNNTILGFGNMKTVDITLSYRYLKITTSKSQRVLNNVVFPTGTSTFVDSSLSIELKEGVYYVSGLRSQTPAILGLFVDSDGRYISAFATKLYTNVNVLYCRSVEIYYKYIADATTFELMPTLGSFATYRGNPKKIGTTTHTEIAPCGDHLCGDPCIGPVWFPFGGCSESKIYNFKQGPGYCFMPYNGEGAEKYQWVGGWSFRPDFRYCLTNHYEAYSGLASAYATCRVEWELFYSKKQGKDRFAGYANIVSHVSEKDYVEKEWHLPPFGNYSRDFVERFMSTDHSAYLWADPVTDIKEEKWAWMPAVIDNNSFYFSFNCFDTYSSTNAQDCFSFVDQMNLKTSDDIEEKIIHDENYDYESGETIIGAPTRFSWDTLFKVRSIIAYSPKPTIYIGETPNGYYYGFTDNSLAWAWQEEWKDIVRDIKEEGEVLNTNVAKLNFLKLLKPSYMYDDKKTQHRFICEEGYYFIKFSAPQYEEGRVIKLPSLTLVKGDQEIGHPRYFEIIHDTYSAIPIEWADEGDGSGSVSGNIYEETSGGGWKTYDNMLFAFDESSSDGVEERTYWTAGFLDWEESYYNRGIIVGMLQSDLLNLPTDELKAIYEIIEQTPIDDSNIIKDIEDSIVACRVANHDVKISFGVESGVCIGRVVVKGLWGFSTSTEKGVPNIYISKAGLSFSYLSIKEETLSLTGISSVTPLSLKSSAPERNSLVEYTIECKMGINPKYVIEDRVLELTISLEAFATEGLIIKSIEIYGVEYSESYKERIYVFEQKFIASTFNNSKNTNDINLDGTEDYLGVRDSIGPLLPLSTPLTDKLSTANKLRSFWGSEKYEYPVSNDGSTERLQIDVTLDNLYKVELDVQKNIYEDTYNSDLIGDELTYTSIYPPILNMSNKKEIYEILPPYKTIFTSNKLSWEDNSIASSYVKYSFWSPGGHYWGWGSDFEMVKCYLFGSKTWKIYHQELIHVLHSGSTSRVMDPAWTYYNGAAVYSNLVEMFTGL